MFLRIFRDRLLKLGKGEEGVALVTTLAVFMVLYMFCCGVFAIGQAVKDRIHLQNACDAAAYSAAVVQADTLSRIATINRAMAWTYIALTRRQMDWVTHKWLDEVCKHWQDDHDRAETWASQSTACCSLVWPHCGHDWNCSPITLHGAEHNNVMAKSLIQGINQSFVPSHSFDNSFYASPGAVTGQIRADWSVLEKMGEAIDEIKDEYNQEVGLAVTDVLEANISDMSKISYNWFFKDMDSYTEIIPNSEEGERRFLSFVRATPKSAFGNSGATTSGTIWFERKTSDAEGFRRGYKWGANVLRANWTWYSNQWHCKKGPDGEDIHIGPVPCPSCRHSSHNRCSCSGYGTFYATVYGDNSRSRDEYYETESRYCAKPCILKQDYFDKAGAITVGVACRNENPWLRILGQIQTGIFKAFDPSSDLKWTVCFASAKAGYKGTLNWTNSEGIEETDRKYRIAWDDGDWNLCQSDWDAVLIPVRRAESLASGGNGGSWQGGVGNFLSGYASKLGVSGSDMRAGGSVNIDSLVQPHDYAEYRFGDDASSVWGGRAMPQDVRTPTVNARWQIGNPNGQLDFDGLKRVMLH